MELLSMIRLGIHLDLVKDLTLSTVNELFLQAQPAHLMSALQANLEGDERDGARARFLRARLGR